jgi:hypothetical protein
VSDDATVAAAASSVSDMIWKQQAVVVGFQHLVSVLLLLLE